MSKLEVDSVVLRYGRRTVLQDVYLECETGRIVGLLGHNGCGKSCLLKILFGELRAEQQFVRMDDRIWTSGRRASSDIRFLPQFHCLPGRLTAMQVMDDFGLDPAGFVGIFPAFERLLKTPLKRLSGGERRIVEIYAVVASDAKFCLLDEPFSNLMPLHAETVKRLLIRQKETKGILLTDHQYRNILDVSDRLYLIRDGRTLRVQEQEDLEKFGYISGW